MNYFFETYLFAMSVLLIAGKSSSEPLELCFRFKSSERQILWINHKHSSVVGKESVNAAFDLRGSYFLFKKIIKRVRLRFQSFSWKTQKSPNKQSSTSREKGLGTSPICTQYRCRSTFILISFDTFLTSFLYSFLLPQAICISD